MIDGISYNILPFINFAESGSSIVMIMDCENEFNLNEVEKFFQYPIVLDDNMQYNNERTQFNFTVLEN